MVPDRMTDVCDLSDLPADQCGHCLLAGPHRPDREPDSRPLCPRCRSRLTVTRPSFRRVHRTDAPAAQVGSARCDGCGWDQHRQGATS